MEENFNGLYIHGTVLSRQKVPVGDNKTCVEYRIKYKDTDGEEHIVAISEWDFIESECFKIEQNVNVKVWPKISGGKIYYAVDKGRRKKGENF